MHMQKIEGEHPLDATALPPAPEIEPPEFLDKLGKNKLGPSASEQYEKTVEWLTAAGCLHLVPDDWIIKYAMLNARWLECEEANTKFGLLTKHHVSNQPTISPYVKAGLEFAKQAQDVWKQIYQVVYDNSQTDFRSFHNPNEDKMFQLLRRREES